MTRLRVAIWARVSTGEQDASSQLEPLRELAAQLGGSVVREYVENESGRRGRAERVRFDAMLKDAEHRRFDLLLFWSLDRFSREGIRKTINYLQRLEQAGARFKSYSEPYLDTENELLRHIVLGVLSYLAELQAKRISEDTIRGLEAARRKGKRLGRPSKYEGLRPKLAQLAAQNERLEPALVARELGISYNSAKSYIERFKGDEPSAGQ